MQVHVFLAAGIQRKESPLHGRGVFQPCVTLQHHGMFQRPFLTVGGRLHDIVLPFPEAPIITHGPELVGKPDTFRHVQQPVWKEHAQLECVIVAFLIVQGRRESRFPDVVHQRSPGFGLGQGSHRRRVLRRVEADRGGSMVASNLIICRPVENVPGKEPAWMVFT